MSVAECRVGELYRACFIGCIKYAVRINNDTLLIPYVLEVDNFWESYKVVKEYYLNVSDIRLHFKVFSFLELEKGDIVKVGKITLVCTEETPPVLDIYVEYPRPEFSLSIKDIKYLGYEGGYYLFNVTLKLKNIGMVVTYSFDEFGRRERLSENPIPVYLLTVDPAPPREVWTMGKFNETHHLLTIPLASGHAFSLRYHFGGGFEDVWREPQHEYIGSYASSGENIWLKIEVYNEYVVKDTVTFITPWGQVYKAKITIEG